uniref:UPF0506 domain-containing protein n=1 Tax=Mesocestoides corti TaxID=53468 RepID=A0A5K3FXI2_MESCO
MVKSQFRVEIRGEKSDKRTAAVQCLTSHLSSSAYFSIHCVFFSLSCKISAEKCKGFGEKCDFTVFNPCCDNLHCVLEGFADGTCQKCLPNAHLCWHDSSCCSGSCAWYRLCR